MGNEQTVPDSSISPKIKTAIECFAQKLIQIESAKAQRSLILDCQVPQQFGNDFNLNQWINIAKYVLENDPTTADCRQKCVPSLIKEDEFWKNYFYLVSEEKKKKKKPPLAQNDEQKEEKKSLDQQSSSSDEDDTFELLLHKPIIWLYKIPATIWRGRNNKCELWNLRNPLWMGRLRIVAYNHGQHIEFQFLEKDGKLFLKSTRIKLEAITPDDNGSNPIHEYFDAYGVIDSSRYFIIWVDVPNKKKTKKIPFGFGIRERLDAFDIRACVADQMKIIRRQTDENYNEVNDGVDGNGDDGHRFELNDDEMISIGHDIDIDQIDTTDNKQDMHHQHSMILKVKTENIVKVGDNVCDDGVYKLPPPPSPPLTPKDELTHIGDIEHHINIHQNKYTVEYNDDDFGEFQTPNDMDNDNEDGYDNDVSQKKQ